MSLERIYIRCFSQFIAYAVPELGYVGKVHSFVCPSICMPYMTSVHVYHELQYVHSWKDQHAIHSFIHSSLVLFFTHSLIPSLSNCFVHSLMGQVDSLLGNSSDTSGFVDALTHESHAAAAGAEAAHASARRSESRDLVNSKRDRAPFAGGGTTHVVTSSSVRVHTGHGGVRMTLHCCCDTLHDAKELNKRLKDSRVRMQAAMREPLIGMHAQLPRYTAFKLIVTSQESVSKSEMHGLQMKWMMNKLGVAHGLRTLTESVGEQDDARVDVSVCIRTGDLSGGPAWQNACAAMVLLEPLVNHKQERWWLDASRAVSRASSALSQASGGQRRALAVLVAVSSDAMQALRDSDSGNVEETILWRLGLSDAAEAAKVFVFGQNEVLEASATGGLTSLQQTMVEFCKMKPQTLNMASSDSKNTSSLWLAARFAARNSRRVPNLSRIRLADIVRSRATAMLASVDVDTIMTEDLICCGLNMFNKECLEPVRSMVNMSFSDILGLPWPVPELAHTSVTWTTVAEAQRLEQMLSDAVVHVPTKRPMQYDEETVEHILSFAYDACVRIIRGKGPNAGDDRRMRTLAEANLASLMKEAESSDVATAKRDAARMLSAALFFR